jgi:tetratricopeptide (TPR) repeat protein
MDIEVALEFANELVFAQTGKHLDDLQTAIFREAWQGKSFTEIAESYPCNESYAKAVGSQLWKLLSSALGEKVTKKSLRTALERRARSQPSRQNPNPPAGVAQRVQPLATEPNFVGRESAIADLNTLISQGKKVILVQAEGGVGKTTLAWHYLNTHAFDLVLPLFMAKERQSITSAESVIEEWLKRYFDEEPGREFSISLDRLRQKLADPNPKIGVLIDNLEPTLENGKFIEEHRSYVEVLRVLTNPTVQSVTLITSREPLYEEGISIQAYPLRGLSLEAWNQFLQCNGTSTNSSLLSHTSALCEMHQAYGGNAEAMFIFSGAIQIECQGDLEAYWQENQDDLLINPTLENLIKSQFNKLQQDNEQAYRLLCRLGCYRYQDVPTVPKEGIFALLWDLPEKRRKRVLNALRDRLLVKVSNEGYYLHPVIREGAIARCRENEDWKMANNKAAEFWTESVKTVEKVEDARRALEAYYHYLEINDSNSACRVIIKERSNTWRLDEPLGVSFYRLGLLRQMIDVVTKIINKINIEDLLIPLYNILGDLYWMSGFPYKAIDHHKESGRLATLYLSTIETERSSKIFLNKIKVMEILSWFNVGLCYIDIGDFLKARYFFKKAIILSKNHGKDRRMFIYSLLLLAFSNYCLNHKKSILRILEISEKEYKNLSKSELTIWGIGYIRLFLAFSYKNLGYYKKSFFLYSEAISFAEESQYIQVKAKALTGIAELYREQGDFQIALSHHKESITILDKLGAKCDLAEAYYQQGITEQKIGNIQNSQKNFDKAIELYTKIQAPRQVEKVQRAIKSGF